jgi:hypothetical protein
MLAVRLFGIYYDLSAHAGGVHVWLEGGNHIKLEFSNATDFVASIAILQSGNAHYDPERKVFATQKAEFPS